MKAIILASVMLFASAAQANDFEKFYHPLPDRGEVVRFDGLAEVMPSSGNGAADVNSMWERGYVVVGYSTFNGPARPEKDAIKFAKKVGARYVVAGAQHTGSRNGAFAAPIGNSVMMMPIVQERFDQQAIYFAELPHRGVGVMITELTNEQKALVGSNKGFVVRAVRRGSPAYDANLVPGDLVKAVNGKPADLDDLKLVIQADGAAHLTVIRLGNPVEVDLNVPSEWR